MSTGDVADFVKRLSASLPQGWFGENPTLVNDLLTGFATLDSFIYGLIAYIVLQMRIQTATGDNLDLIACDYFGDILTRNHCIRDDVFRQLILSTLLQEQATRQGMFNAVKNLTGNDPLIIEPWNYADLGAFNVPIWGFNTAGGFGSGAPYNFWIVVYVTSPIDTTYGGFNGDTWGWSVFGSGANGAYLSESNDNHCGLKDAEIIDLINRVKVYGTVAHITIVRI